VFKWKFAIGIQMNYCTTHSFRQRPGLCGNSLSGR
jgi:hypothetical protein